MSCFYWILAQLIVCVHDLLEQGCQKWGPRVICQVLGFGCKMVPRFVRSITTELFLGREYSLRTSLQHVQLNITVMKQYVTINLLAFGRLTRNTVLHLAFCLADTFLFWPPHGKISGYPCSRMWCHAFRWRAGPRYDLHKDSCVS